MDVKINKSSRHKKITGDFTEQLILYLLSKHGFECSYVNHTGIDIIARNPHTKELMGISVKGRSRKTGTEGDYVNIPRKNFEKVDEACKTFGCIPYFAIVVDEKERIYVFILSKNELLRLHPLGKTTCAWTMGEKRMKEYYHNDKIKIFEFNYKIHNWWK
jgi:Holliday junction resolvase-like predicted endonuclease